MCPSLHCDQTDEGVADIRDPDGYDQPLVILAFDY
jgi:hypothetical protein